MADEGAGRRTAKLAIDSRQQFLLDEIQKAIAAFIQAAAAHREAGRSEIVDSAVHRVGVRDRDYHRLWNLSVATELVAHRRCRRNVGFTVEHDRDWISPIGGALFEGGRQHDVDPAGLLEDGRLNLERLNAAAARDGDDVACLSDQRGRLLSLSKPGARSIHDY
jgi:hypothetical protein